MAVHNHGTEQGAGLACPESLIGECLIKEGGETIEGLRAERDGLLATIEQVLSVSKRARPSSVSGNLIADGNALARILTTSPDQSLATLQAAAWWRGVSHQWKHRPIGNRVAEAENPYTKEATS